ncbi:MAG: hypothetical protein OHK0039_10900 [Bacteroidia bacterium]
MRHLRYLLPLLALGACQLAEPAREPAAPAYEEPYRPQVHFSPATNWMNDPNGMVFFGGEYHLFYQYYPDSTVWGPMHWGHAISRDLVHWEHLPIALYPDSLGYIFSGSAVVDWNNSSGFGTGDQPPLVAIFTYHDPEGDKAGRIDYQTQGIAYSLDKGRTWTKYEGNPVLPNPGIRDFRDPKVFWHAETEQWVMILAAADRVRLYRSSDLRSWSFASEFGAGVGAHGGVWECPDLFAMELAGKTYWVLLLSINPGGPNGGSATQYFVGDFDGQTFTNSYPDSVVHWIDYGKDNYAGVTWSDVPAADGRRIFLGWMSNWQYANQVPTHPWRSAMTLPRVLELYAHPGGPRLRNTPVREVEVLRGTAAELPALAVEGTQALPGVGFAPAPGEYLLRFDLAQSDAASLGLLFANAQGDTLRIGCLPGQDSLFIDRRAAGVGAFSQDFAGVQMAPHSLGSTLELRIVVDRSSVEVFADGGTGVMTALCFPATPYTEAALFARGGTARLDTGTAYPLASIW